LHKLAQVKWYENRELKAHGRKKLSGNTVNRTMQGAFLTVAPAEGKKKDGKAGSINGMMNNNNDMGGYRHLGSFSFYGKEDKAERAKAAGSGKFSPSRPPIKLIK